MVLKRNLSVTDLVCVHTIDSYEQLLEVERELLNDAERGGDTGEEKIETDDEDDDDDDGIKGEERDGFIASNSVETIDEERCRQVLYRMRYLTCMAAIGGFLSGYNTGVISGALLPLTRVFGLVPMQEEAIVFATIVFAFAASALGGEVNQVVGRRITIMIAASVFTIGAVVIFSAQNYTMVVMGEALLGIGVGVESLTSPLYIAELSKPSVRGMLVSAYAFMVCFGQFFAGIVDGVAGAFDDGWRYMFGFAAIPGTIMFLGFYGLPESPAWLLHAGREKEAKTVLHSIRSSDIEVELESKSIIDSIRSTASRQSQGKNSERGVNSAQIMFKQPSTRQALMVGCSLMVLQQFCGSNVVMYYSATVYRMSGFGELTAIWLSAFTAVAQLVGLAMSVYMVETKGRRPLVLFSFAGVAVCLFGLGCSFYLARLVSGDVDPTMSDPECMVQPALVWNGVTSYCYDCTTIEGCGYCGGACVRGSPLGPIDSTCPAQGSGFGTDHSNDVEWSYDICPTDSSSFSSWIGWMPVFFMVCYLIVFGIGAGGLPWTINSEIYPVECRSQAVAFSTATNWLCNLLVSSTFLTISQPEVLTLYGSFWMYSVISVLGVVWLYFTLPETRGLSLEEIEVVFSRRAASASSGVVPSSKPHPDFVSPATRFLLNAEEDDEGDSYEDYGAMDAMTLTSGR